MTSYSGIVYVVDSSDERRFEEAREELFKVLEYNELEDVPILILANKQDLPGAQSVTEVTNALTLHKLNSKHDWFIQPCCAKVGDGVYEGFNRFADMLKEYNRKHKH